MRLVLRAASLAVLATTLLLGAELAAPSAALAEGYALDGRLAPELTFPAGLNGIEAGTTLSDFRGRVVWLKFVLRDCPRCRAELPRAQQLHERWGGSGLVVLVVVHGYMPAQIQPFLSQNGYTFRVASDPRGELAARYGVGHRPTDYVIGIDGRVRYSNGSPDSVLLTELGRYRLARLGPVPTSLESVRQAVWNWDYGTALRTLEPAAAAADASQEVKQLAARVREQSREELDARIALAQLYERRRQTAAAGTIYDRVAAHFRGTSLAGAAAEARSRFLARSGS